MITVYLAWFFRPKNYKIHRVLRAQDSSVSYSQTHQVTKNNFQNKRCFDLGEDAKSYVLFLTASVVQIITLTLMICVTIDGQESKSCVMNKRK